MTSANADDRSSRMVQILVVTFFACLILLVVQVLLNMKDYTDSWILGGLFPYFVLLTLSYSALVSFSPSMKLTALVSGLYLVALNAIPNLKYVFVYGYHDPLNHFASISSTIASGHVSEVGSYATQYGATPGIHLFVSELSILTGLDALSAFKLFLIFSPFIIPLAVYFAVKRLNMPLGLAKATVVSAVVVAPVTYIYTGTTSTYPLYVMFISFCLLFFSLGSPSRREFMVALLIGGAIVISHDSTSFFLLVIMSLSLLFIGLGRRIRILDRIPHFSTLFTLSFATLVLAHLTLSSSVHNLSQLLSVLRSMITGLFERQVAATSYYPGFYSLSIIDRAKILFVTYGNTAILLLIIAVAPLAIYRLRLTKSKLKNFYAITSFATLITFVASLVFLFVNPAPGRALIYLAAFSPFLAGTTLFYLFFSRRCRFNHLIMTIAVFLLVCITALSVYPFQPLLPRISATEGSYYAYDLRQVNTIYDRSLVLFVSEHDSRLNVGADDILGGQILALTNSDFQSLVVSNNEEAALLLLSESHAIPSGRAAISNQQYIQNMSMSDDILYSNGLSYLMMNTTNANFR